MICLNSVLRRPVRCRERQLGSTYSQGFASFLSMDLFGQIRGCISRALPEALYPEALYPEALYPGALYEELVLHFHGGSPAGFTQI